MRHIINITVRMSSRRFCVTGFLYSLLALETLLIIFFNIKTWTTVTIIDRQTREMDAYLYDIDLAMTTKLYRLHIIIGT